MRLRTEFDAIRGDRSNVDYRTIEDSLDSALFALAPRPREYWTTMRGYHCWSWWLAWLGEQIRTTVTGSRPDEAWEALHDASEAMLMLFELCPVFARTLASEAKPQGRRTLRDSTHLQQTRGASAVVADQGRG